MRLLFTPWLGKILIVTFFSFFISAADAQQTLTKINGMNAYVHLPDDYGSGAKDYPLILFVPGIGEIGTDASKLLYYGPSKFVADGERMQFSVNGVVEKPIVISVQPVSAWPRGDFMDETIDYIIKTWKVDKKRIYLTGLSMGGWTMNTYVTGSDKYAKRIAAIVALSSPPADNPIANYSWYASAGGKWWGIEGLLDLRGNSKVAAAMNSYKAGSGRYTTYIGGHCCWNTFYDPDWKENGESIYTWMLKQNQVISGNEGEGNGTDGEDDDDDEDDNDSPTNNAGLDISIRLPLNTATLKGSATDGDGSIKSYSWARVSGPATYTIVSPNSSQTAVTNLVSGVYEFELTVTDDDGAVAKDRVKVTVLAAIPVLDPILGQAKDRILIDLGDLPGSTKDRWGKYWNKVVDARDGNISKYLVNEDNVQTPVSFEIVERIDGTYDLDGPGINHESNIGEVGDYPANAVNDNAYAHTSTRTGKWRIYGLNLKNEYRIKFWGARSTSAPRNIEIRRTTDTVWKTFNAQENRDYNEAAYFEIGNATEVTFEMRIPAGSQFGNISLIDIAVLSPGILGTLLNTVTSSQTGVASTRIQEDAAGGEMSSSMLYKAGLHLYPNPVLGDVNITIANRQSGPVTISVVSQTGVLLKTFKYIKQGSYLNQRLSLPDLPKGTYFLKVNMPGFNEVKPFVKL